MKAIITERVDRITLECKEAMTVAGISYCRLYREKRKSGIDGRQIKFYLVRNMQLLNIAKLNHNLKDWNVQAVISIENSLIIKERINK